MPCQCLLTIVQVSELHDTISRLLLFVLTEEFRFVGEINESVATYLDSQQVLHRTIVIGLCCIALAMYELDFMENWLIVAVVNDDTLF